MAIKGFDSYLPYPSFEEIAGYGNGYNAVTLDSANEGTVFVLFPDKTVVASSLGFMTGTVTSGGMLYCYLCTVGTTGYPETFLATGSISLANTDDNSWFFVPLGSTPTLTVGSGYALFIQHDSAGAGFNGGIRYQYYTGAFSNSWNMIGRRTFLSGTWAESEYVNCLAYVEDINGNGVPMLGSLVPALIRQRLATASSGYNEWGNKFTILSPIQVSGIGFFAEIDNAPVQFTCKVYDADTSTVIASTNNIYAQWAGQDVVANIYYFTSAVVLSANTTYIATITVNANKTTLGISGCSRGEKGLNALSAGTAITLAYRNSTSEWLYATDSRTQLALLISGFDDGTAQPAPGGGGVEQGGVWGF